MSSSPIGRFQKVLVERKRLFVLLGALGVVLLIGGTSGDSRLPIASSETRFVEYSESGMQIVPASCPSYAHFTGDCSATPPAPGATNQCSISSVHDSIESGQSTTLGWSTYAPSGAQPPTELNGGSGPINTTISPTIGSVPWSGSTSVSPTVSTTYTLSGVYRMCIKGCSDSNFSCSRTITVTAPACTPSYSCSGSNLINNCDGSTVQVCAYGCASGGCLAAPPGVGNITASPALIRQGEKATIAWTTGNMSSCSVSENNPAFVDAWTGTTGSQLSSVINEQTSYTLTCTPIIGGTFTDSATVNIIPAFEEQ